jgi:hypothetical protein
VLSRWAARPEPFVRRSVLRGLRELRFAQPFDPALQALTDTDADVRLEAFSSERLCAAAARTSASSSSNAAQSASTTSSFSQAPSTQAA